MKNLIRSLVLVAIFTASVSPANLYASSHLVSASASTLLVSYPDGTGGVWNEQVITYLTLKGYIGAQVFYIDSYGNRRCHSVNRIGYYTIVYVNNGCIVGSQDVPEGE